MPYNVVTLNEIGCHRGKLMVFEDGCNLDFQPKRTYIIYGNKSNVRRGYHAHRNLKQLAICVHGSCKFIVYDGKNQEVIELDSPSKGLFIEGLVWREMFDFSDDCVLMVLADSQYDPEDYIRNYQDFLKIVGDTE